MSRKLYIHTIGCQMNVYDSEKIAAVLWPMGYIHTDGPEDADLVVVNTCAIRAKAEQKVFSYLGRLAEEKRRRPGVMIAVGGCVAQQEGERILKRVPAVDLVFGTHAIGRLSSLVERIRSGGARLVDTEMTGRADMGPIEAGAAPAGGISRFVTIMHGCDNYCTYCVVPNVRGREASRLPEDIVEEIESLVAAGVREVTLLGQNVNSYGQKEGLPHFAELLRRIDGISGLARIRFTTSHPKDLSPDLMHAFARLPKLCHHIHLPVQSGSNSVLRRMNRGYSRETYLDRLDTLREHCPGIAVSTDIIVGFPGETEGDFSQTLDLISTAAFDGLFAFQYSDRPSAPASRFRDKASEDVKKARLQNVLALQEQYTRRQHLSMVGDRLDVLVEGPGKRIDASGTPSPARESLWTGRTTTNKIVHFRADADTAAVAPGRLVPVTIEKGFSHSLWGRMATSQPHDKNTKGVKQHAA